MILLVATSLLAAVTVLWIQSRFEAGDENNALALVQAYQSKAGVSIPDVIANRHPEKVVEWSTATESSCFQHIRVHAVVRGDRAAEPVVYAFVVDINGPVIHPGNEPGRELLAALDHALPAVSAQTAGSAQATTSAANASATASTRAAAQAAGSAP
jgi:hypothetical protein